MAKQVNQQLIADQLKLSRTTVSRCFTNHPGVNPETRGRVFKLAAAIGYNHLLPRTRNSRAETSSRQIGALICTSVEDYLNTDFESPGKNLLAGVSEFVQANRWNMDVHFVDPKDSRLTEPSYAKIDAISKRTWDGVILVYPFPQPVVDELSLLAPVVSLVEQYSGAPINCVDVDHHRGIAAIVRLLADEGHTRIGFLTQDYGIDANWALRRYSAFLEETTRLGLPVDPANVLNVRPDDRCSPNQAYERALMRTRYGVTAWVCAADHQAYGLVSFLQNHGLQVPTDVSVTGFDGIEKPDGAPQLTTVNIPYFEIGRIGCKRLSDLVEKRCGSAQHILHNCVIGQGQTVGPPASQ